MDKLLQRFDAIRHEIDSLKAALQTATDEAERNRIHDHINTCIRKSFQLIDQRLSRRTAASSVAPENVEETTRHRSVGEDRA